MCPKCLDRVYAGNQSSVVGKSSNFPQKRGREPRHTGQEKWLDVISRQVDVFSFFFTSIKLCRWV